MTKGVTSPLTIAAFALVLINAAGGKEPVNFSRDILPVLSDRCFHCHGPDEANRKADLRLDERESAVNLGAIVPGDPDASELLARTISQDPEMRMPPPAAHRKQLSARELAAIREWIAAGAPWGRHWSFEKPQRPSVPDGQLHPIDAFVRSRLSQEHLAPAEQAAQATLLRRVSFDLTGIPPLIDEVESVISDKSPHAYERFVDRLFTSPHYGERMAMWWLDAARYSDTDGYQQDATRVNWPWRDWVVESFNANMPFDRFTIEQFAGDLLPDATPEQKLATCFHRNHMTNGEGGRDPEESRIDYVLDRVNTTGSVWLGLTLGCSQCHAHKFDPITQEDYYSLFAFFNSIDEDGKAGLGAKPYLQYTSPYVQRSIDETRPIVVARKRVVAVAQAQAERDLDRWLQERIAQVREGFEPWRILGRATCESVEGSVLTQETDGVIQVSGPNPRQDDYRVITSSRLARITGIRLEVFPHETHTAGKLSRGANGEFILTDVKLQVKRRTGSLVRDIEIVSAIADVEKKAEGRNYGNVKDTLDDDPRNGWTTETHDPTERHVAVFALAEPLRLAPDEDLIFVLLHRSTRGDANIGRFRVSVTDQPGSAVRSLEPMPLQVLAGAEPQDSASIDEALRDRLFEQYLVDHLEYQRAREELDRATRQLASLERKREGQAVMVLAERETARATHVLLRGVWDQEGQVVPRGFPEAILPWPAEESRTRLDFAKWLVSSDNPLTARVVVNQLWQLCFGAGLVRTPEDFGLQGELPTHPKLLDWLAVELIENEWDLQHLLRLIVTSQTYRQSSHMTQDVLEHDPENRLLARASRFRLPSWMIRDAALRSSGLMDPGTGGPPVMPYQPDGIWAEMFMGRFRYEPSQGSSQYRRTLYAFWRRAAAPTFLFDSAQRRVCEVRPRRTNTPLHALTLLNDLTVLESSRSLSRSAIARAVDPSARIDFIYRSILSRSPTQSEEIVLLRELARSQSHYRTNPTEAKRLLQFGQPEERETTNHTELASYTVMTSMVYNLDEAISHE